MKEIMENGPIVLSFEPGSMFMSYSTGVVGSQAHEQARLATHTTD